MNDRQKKVFRNNVGDADDKTNNAAFGLSDAAAHLNLAASLQDARDLEAAVKSLDEVIADVRSAKASIQKALRLLEKKETK